MAGLSLREGGGFRRGSRSGGGDFIGLRVAGFCRPLGCGLARGLTELSIIFNMSFFFNLVEATELRKLRCRGPLVALMREAILGGSDFSTSSSNSLKLAKSRARSAASEHYEALKSTESEYICILYLFSPLLGSAASISWSYFGRVSVIKDEYLV